MNPSKRKGTAWESAVRDHFKAAGFDGAERLALSGSQDRGDLTGLPAVTIECKATKDINLSNAVDEAVLEAGRARTRWAAAVIKRRNRPTSSAYVVMPLGVWTDLYLTALAGLEADGD